MADDSIQEKTCDNQKEYPESQFNLVSDLLQLPNQCRASHMFFAAKNTYIRINSGIINAETSV